MSYIYRPGNLGSTPKKDPVTIPLSKILNFTGKAQKVGPDMYQFTLFTPEFCRYLLDIADKSNEWVPDGEVDKKGKTVGFEPGWGSHPPQGRQAPSLFNFMDNYRARYFGTDTDDGEHPNAMALASLPGMEEIYTTVVRKHVSPLIKKLWPYFTRQVWDQPVILRYDATAPKKERGMEMHLDDENLAMVVYLNNEYKGGGTYFPVQNITAKPPAGSAVMFPGGLTHPHSGLPVTSGSRYILLGGFY